MIYKTCKVCKINKDINDFTKCKECRDGYTNQCKKCIYDKLRSRIESDREKFNKKARNWRQTPAAKGKISKYNKSYGEKNKDLNKIRRKKYTEENRDKIREYNNQYTKERMLNDPIFKLKKTIRSRIKEVFDSKQYTKKSKTHEILGCSYDELMVYLESKFEPWMTWENKGLYNGELNYGWDIDHIIPLSSAKTEEDIIKLNHYTNLQPLCSKINRDIKKDRIT